ncbi:MAG: prolipoprotein diacylglyceryl transferase, partial [Clostridiales bacterium]|nr:prolipoprotein diacylglyceryl transferase [Clostridiales bacterium]
YGFGRMLIEGLRTDRLYLFDTGLRVSQVLAGISCATALIYLAINGSIPHDKNKMLVNARSAEVKSSDASEADNGR